MEDLCSRSSAVVYILFLILSEGYAEVTNFGMCKDPDCSDPLGLGETTLSYNAPDEDRISFGVGLQVKIFSKDAGAKNDLLGVEVHGKRGYVPKHMVRETMSYMKNMTLVPAKSKFGALSSILENVGDKPAKKAIHSPSDDDPVHSTNLPADDPVPSSGHSPNGPTPTSSPLPDESVPSSGTSVPSSNPSAAESIPSFPSTQEENSSQNDEKALDAEGNGQSRSEVGENVAIQNESEPADKNSHLTETSAVDSSESHASHSSATDALGISSSSVAHSEAFSTPVNSIPHSSQSDFRTSDVADIVSVQHSHDQSENSDHHVDTVLPTKDVVLGINPTGAGNVDSSSTEYVGYKHSDSSADLNSSMSGEEHGTVSEKLSSAHAQVTESLPHAIDAVVESFSSGSMKLDTDAAQQVTQSPFQETYKKESVAPGIEATLAILQKQGFNVSDMAADNDVDLDLTAESSYNTYPESQSVELHGDFHAQNAHKNLPRKPPFVGNLEEGLKNLDKEHSHENKKVLSSAPQQHSSKKNAKSRSDDLPGEAPETEKFSKVFSEDTTSTSTQRSTLTKAEGNTVDTALPPDTDNQYISDSSKHPNVGINVPLVSSQESKLHTSLDGVGYDKKYSSGTHHPIPKHQHENTHQDFVTHNKNEDSYVHLTATEHTDLESSVLSTGDFSEATVQSESYVTTKPIEDYSSSTTETTFVSRHLKSEDEPDDLREDGQYEKQDVLSDSSSFIEMFNNSIEGLRSFIEVVMLWLPEPIQLYLLDLQSKGVPPRAAVFTALIALPTIFLIISIIYIRQSSKEKSLLVKLSDAEQKLFLATTERDVLKEDIGKLKNQINTLQSDLGQEQKSSTILKKKLEKSEYLSQSNCAELRSQLKDLESQVEMKTGSMSALQTALEQCKETNGLLQRKLQEEENAVSTITVQLQEFEEEVRTLQKEKEDLNENEASYKEKNVELEQSCNQLLEEAEVWNSRVNELNQQLENETSCREELENSVQSKDSEIQSLQNAIMNFQVIQEFKNSNDADENTFEEKMKQMLDTSAVQIKLKKAEDERNTILKSFESERSRVMELELEMLEAQSEIEKLKSNYNQALQDKTEAQTKLEVLSNYFKDKEMQLQKELGVQEAVRQQKEEDASFAARRVNLIEEENASYKYQVATVKQEIEETERNYKNQVALQEKKAHENWLAARAAERKLEDMKQESAQLRQRLTLLEREQENWLNSSRDEIVRPVPKRPGGPNGEIGTQEINRSKDSSSGSLPMPHEMLPPLRPPILPLDRPLPPVRMPMMEPRGFPPPMDPYFDFGPPLPFPPQPWHSRGPPPDPLHPLDRRTPSSYERGRLTPPVSRRHHSPTISDKDIGRRSASPKEISSRGSHTSSPPHPLPHFHDIPPPPGSYDFRHGPPPPLSSRYPLPPPPRREFLSQGPGLTRTDSRNSDMITSTPRGAHQLPPAQDRRQQQPSSRV